MTENDDILIDLYLRSALTEKDQEQFNKRMQDSTFAAEVREFELVKNASILSGQISLKTELQNLEKQNPADLPSTNFSLLKKAVIIGLFIILLISSFLLIRNYKSTPIQKELYATYYEKFPNVVDPITKSSENDDVLTISQYYELGKFDTAISAGKVLENLLGNPSQKLNEAENGSLFYLALSYMQKDKHENAQVIFEQLLSEPGNFRNAILYYNALSLLASDHIDEAIDLLSRLSTDEEPSSPYIKESIEIINALD